MNLQQRIDAFLEGDSFAVAGASRERFKYGNKVLRAYLQNDRVVYPVNPQTDEVEGQTAYPDLASLPEQVHGVSIVTPPDISAKIIEQAAALGIGHVWLQPGAETPEIVARAEELGLNVIAGGPCLLVVIGYSEAGN